MSSFANKHIFPARAKVAVVHVALQANGDSSYRDASHIVQYSSRLWGSNAEFTVITDKKNLSIPNARVLVVSGSKQLLTELGKTVMDKSITHDILFILSSHGYSNGAQQSFRCNGQSVTDSDLGRALFEHMNANCSSFFLLDACHSGTLLDLKYHTREDGKSVATTSALTFGGENVAIAIGACSDSELSEEGISDFGGWGGGLVAEFFDFVSSQQGNNGKIDILKFFKRVHNTFTNKTVIRLVGDRRQHPILSFTNPLLYLERLLH